MPSVEVILPWRDGCAHRRRALTWVLQRYIATHPSWTVTIAPAPAGDWCKAAAVNPAVAASTAEVLIVADADIWTVGLRAAVDHVIAGAPWAIPHLLVHRLTAACTADMLTGRDPILEHAERPYRGVPGGGAIVLPRRTLLDIPLDERFTGWGQEDVSHAVALQVLAGPAIRGTADLLHLWHPPQDRLTRKVGSTAGQQLHRRYLRARRFPEQMRALVQEARRDDHRSHQPDMHARSPVAG